MSSKTSDLIERLEGERAERYKNAYLKRSSISIKRLTMKLLRHILGKLPIQTKD